MHDLSYKFHMLDCIWFELVCCLKILLFLSTVPPTIKRITSIPKRAVLGKPVVILCDALVDVPVQDYFIIHNDTEVVSQHKLHIIEDLDYTSAGTYKCVATNTLGNSSMVYNLSVFGKLLW